MILALQYSFLEGVLKSIVCIAVVYAMLFLLSYVLRALKPLAALIEGKKPEPKPEETPVVPTQKPFSVEDIKDDDMMAAILVAAIDYRETTKQEPNVVSAKEIK